jgi:hypothetical protein
MPRLNHSISPIKIGSEEETVSFSVCNPQAMIYLNGKLLFTAYAES